MRAKLLSQPEQSLKLATKAMQLKPDGLLAQLVGAHAQLLLGRSDLAAQRFLEIAAQQDPQQASGEWPVVHRVAAARAFLLTENYAEAHLAYRRAVLFLDEIPSSEEQVKVLIEAATMAAYHHTDYYGEAASYLHRARSLNAPLLKVVVDSALQLLAIRRSPEEAQKAQTNSEKEERRRQGWRLLWVFEQAPEQSTDFESHLPLLPVGERQALLAASFDASEAQQYWLQFDSETEGRLPPHLRSRVQ